jgi:hypothetical protein
MIKCVPIRESFEYCKKCRWSQPVAVQSLKYLFPENYSLTIGKGCVLVEKEALPSFMKVKGNCMVVAFYSSHDNSLFLEPCCEAD